jgi:phospholipid/cholesterol/gamma-HCH transport system ATP-binding protein
MGVHNAAEPAMDGGAPEANGASPIEVRGLTMRYGPLVVMEDLNFQVRRGEIFVIMGGSGSGKSTLLKHLIGLKAPAEGSILFEGQDFLQADARTRKGILRRMGVLYQNGALWSGLTLAENVALPLEEYTELDARSIGEVVSLKLSLVGLRGFEAFYPAEISGGMRKRAALARATALDPEVLFFDEPSSGLDPISASRLDDLILQLRESFGTTIVVVSHDLESIFKIADRALFLDIKEKTMTAMGTPEGLRERPPSDEVRRFMTRSSEAGPEAGSEVGPEAGSEVGPGAGLQAGPSQGSGASRDRKSPKPRKEP